MEQQELFAEDVWEAQRVACRAIAARDGTKAWAKHVGSLLFPAKSPEDAAKYLQNCLDKDRPEKLDADQFLWIIREAKRAGCHVLMAHICNEAEYQRTTPICPKDRQADLMREFIQTVGKLDEIKRELGKVSG